MLAGTERIQRDLFARKTVGADINDLDILLCKQFAVVQETTLDSIVRSGTFEGLGLQICHGCHRQACIPVGWDQPLLGDATRANDADLRPEGSPQPGPHSQLGEQRLFVHR
ncbi:MAG: hypothetical protein AMS21_04795 [Gemmatimonas sp. SG8_38_2]|nr:MAG: hypothetical protein AMS21_04795 [Gemmatimonas sp. SG8_38_2]